MDDDLLKKLNEDLEFRSIKDEAIKASKKAVEEVIIASGKLFSCVEYAKEKYGIIVSDLKTLFGEEE